MGKIFYVMGKSSSGKDTIYNSLIKDSDLDLKTLVGYTTRPMREGELNGREYFFTDEEGLKRLEEDNKVIEVRGYETVCGMWYYFTVDDEQVDLNVNNYLLIGTLESYKKVREYYGKDAVIPIYVYVEDGERLSRALNREKVQKNPNYAEMCRRFLADGIDFDESKIYEADIKVRYENNEFEECYGRIKMDIIRNCSSV
jgi:guanylate kinase